MAIARITDIRGLVTIGENGEEILKNRDMISEHGGLLTINEFAKIIFDDGREIEVTGPVTFSLDESFFSEGTFEDSITQISDLSSLEYINNNLETIINNENLNSNLLDQNQTNTDIQTEQLNSQIVTDNNQLFANQNNSDNEQTTNTTQNTVATDTTQDTDTTTATPDTVDPVEVQINDISLVSLVEDTATSGTKVADFNVTGGNIGSITLTVAPSQYFVISGTDILLTQEGANLVNSGQDLPTFSITASDIESGLSSTDSATLADTTDVDDGLTVTVNNVISSITEGDADTSTVVGNASSTNPDGSTITYTISDTTNYSIDPSTGAITLTAAGAKVVNDGGDLPNFTVSASSTTGDTGTSGEVNPADTTSTNVNPDAVNDGNITTETVTINTSNVNDTNNGFTVTAQNPDGTTGSLSSNSYGFGVSGSASGSDSELGHKSGVGSEKILVNFDENVSSVDVSFGWKNSSENAIIKFYKDGVEVGSTTHYGGTDGVDTAVTLKPDNGATFDQVVFSAPEGDHDYMINSISFNKVTSDITTDEDTSITVDVLANDTDGNNDSLSITQIQGQDVSSGQTVNVTQDGQVIGTARVVNGEIEFTPGSTLQSMNNGESENVSFEYTISDGRGGSDTASVNIKVTGSDEVDNTATAPTITASLGDEVVINNNVPSGLEIDTVQDIAEMGNIITSADYSSSGDYKSNINTNNDGVDQIDIGRDAKKSINVDDGNNIIDIGRDAKSSINAGDGDDKLRIEDDAQYINLGNGNNEIEIGNDAKSSIQTGSGKDKINIGGKAKNSIETGADDDIVNIGNNAERSINLGSGDNELSIGNDAKNSIQATDGDDLVTIGNNASSISLGDGENQLKVGGDVSSTITTGTGNDKIVIGGDARTINSGAGHDKIDIGEHAKSSINTGSGDDMVRIGKNAENSVNLDSGNNQLQIGTDAKNTISALDGNDTIRIGDDAESTINLGDGYNRLQVGDDANVINGGSGVDEINIGASTGDGDAKNSINTKDGDDIVRISGNAQSIDLGDGNNQLEIGKDAQNSITAGNDNDTIKIGGDAKSTIKLGDGHNKLEIGDDAKTIIGGNQVDEINIGTKAGIESGDAESSIDTKDGDDIVRIHGDAKSSVSLGEGNDQLYVGDDTSNSVTAGAGHDTINIGGDAKSTIQLNDGNDQLSVAGNTKHINAGDGDDIITVGGNVGSSVSLGNGNDFIKVGGNVDSSIEAGDGADTVILGGNAKNSVTMGDGNDYLEVGGYTNSTVNMGDGDDIVKVNGEIKGQMNGGSGNDVLYLDMTQAEYNADSSLQNKISNFETIVFNDNTFIGDASLVNKDQTVDTNKTVDTVDSLDSVNVDNLSNIDDINWSGSSSTTYEYPVNLSVTNNDSDSETLTVKIVVENLPSGATISQNGVEISATNGNEYVLNANDLSNIKISSPTQIASDGAGGLKISVEATSTESNGGAEALQTAVLVDGVVEGAYYETSSGITGYTDANGSFSFKAGDSVTFSVGGVVLGVATAEDIASGKTFLQDIADVSRTDLNDEYLENMAVFLQSIDTADSGDNIVITDAMHEALKDANIDLRTASEEEVKDLVESVGGTYVDEDDAMVHVKEMLQEYANMEEGEFDQRVEDEDNESAVLGKEPQAGIEYTTSSGLTGITNENGEFEYNDGDSITFSKDGVELSTIESSAIGDDALITMNELTSLNQNEIDVDNIELDFDNLASILDIESGESDIKDVDIDDLDIKDMLIQDGENSLSTLLGEDDDVVSSSPETDATNSASNASTEDEYCPFKTLEESSNGMMTNMDLEDNSTFHDE